MALLLAACSDDPTTSLDADASAGVDAAGSVDAAPACNHSDTTADGGPPIIGPSCSGLAETCGPGGDESCCASTVVPGGCYYRGYDVAPDDYNDMSYPARVSDFRLDRFEITVGRFRKFVEAGKGTQADPPADGSGAHAANAASGWQSSWNSMLPASTEDLIEGFRCWPTMPSLETWTDSPGANENMPMNCISWYEAMAFCIWDGGYLPTEAEWNYAAAGGDEQRAYPWSSPPSSTEIDQAYASFNGMTAQNVGSRSPKGDGRWDHADLAGNLFEWALDYYHPAYLTPCDNCADIADGFSRVVRSSAFQFDEASHRTALRSGHDPSFRGRWYGARCARIP